MKKSQIEFYIRKYRQQFVPIAFYFFALFIVLRIFLPQLTQFQIIKGELADIRNEVDILESSIETLRATDATELGNTVELANQALPQEQDLTHIISAISVGAISSGNDVEGYSLKPGELYNSESNEELSTRRVVQEAGVQEAVVELRISGDDLGSVVDYIQELQNTLPLSEVTEYTAREGSGNLSVAFFYKPVNPSSFGKKNVVAPLKGTDIELLAKLRNFNN